MKNLPERSLGINSPTLLIKSVQEADEGDYYCVVTNEWDSMVASYFGTLEVICKCLSYQCSCNYSLHVVGLPKFLTQPSEQHVGLHSTAKFTCIATGNGTLTYYWSKDGSVVQSSAVQVLNIQNVSVSDSGHYQCHVRNKDGLIANSSTAELLGKNILCRIIQVQEKIKLLA